MLYYSVTLVNTEDGCDNKDEDEEDDNEDYCEFCSNRILHYFPMSVC